MNYLAHFHLARRVAHNTGLHESDLLIGALLGDAVKGPLKGHYPEGWEVGIRLHRRIDALTDHHPTVSSLTATLPDHYRRFAGIMLDVCFDHCLSLDWPQHEAQPLADFSQHCYDQLLPGKSDYPATAARQIYYLARYDVLSGMDHWPQIEAMLERIDQRFRRPTPLAEAGPTLARALPTVREGFAQLYPALINQLSEEFGGG